MKQMYIVLIIFMIALNTSLYSQNPFKYFLKPRPIYHNVNKESLRSNETHWEFKPIVQIPALKINKSKRDNAKIDATFLVSTGGGVTLQHSYLDGDTWRSDISFSGIILLKGDTSNDNTFNIAVGGTIGFFNNLIQLGGGVDLGSVSEESQRYFGMFSFGINITQNK